VSSTSSPSTVGVWLISCTERHEPELALPGRDANVHERPALHPRGQSRRRASQEGRSRFQHARGACRASPRELILRFWASNLSSIHLAFKHHAQALRDATSAVDTMRETGTTGIRWMRGGRADDGRSATRRPSAVSVPLAPSPALLPPVSAEHYGWPMDAPKAGRMTLGQPVATERTAASALRPLVLPSPQALRIAFEHVDAYSQEDRYQERPSL
jgi:hypothetical protein